MLAVSADHDLRLLGDVLAALYMPADPAHGSVLEKDLVHREALAKLRASLDRGIDQELVENGPPRAIAVRNPVDRSWGPLDPNRAEVERVGHHRRAPGLLEPLQQPPALQRRDAGRMDHVCRHRVAREGRLIYEQDSVALPGQ